MPSDPKYNFLIDPEIKINPLILKINQYEKSINSGR
jgi:hypothetical protein